MEETRCAKTIGLVSKYIFKNNLKIKLYIYVYIIYLFINLFEGIEHL